MMRQHIEVKLPIRSRPWDNHKSGRPVLCGTTFGRVHAVVDALRRETRGSDVRGLAPRHIGLIVPSGLHGALFYQLAPSIPGRSWLAKGLLFGATLWAIYWLFQEWFIYVTLVKEPLPLALLELAVLLFGLLLEGDVIA